MDQSKEKQKNCIRILPEEVVNRIAAGEVIERPSSVIKELVENSIDAKSDQIIIWVKDGGKTLIKVTDNGIGMSEQDALLAIERHATSKIRTSEDLNSINQLGFRGEALSSIAAVSLLEIKTGLSNSSIGHSIRVEAGHIEEVKETAWEGGTSLSVRNLFYNTPARRKFLRTNNTEMRHIVKIFKQFALGHPDKAFSLFHGNQPLWELGKMTLDQRIKEVFTQSFFDLLMNVEINVNGMNLTGYIAKPELVRSWAGEQYLYLNKRAIRNYSLRKAVFSAYGTTLAKGATPFFLLFLDVDPNNVDVNVHPAKWEVRFQNEREIYLTIFDAIRQRLAEGSYNPAASTDEPQADYNVFPPSDYHKYPPQTTIKPDIHGDTPLFTKESFYQRDKSSITKQSSGVDPGKIWQVHNKYIISQVKTGIMIIDQHAAHERILYERTKEILTTKGGLSQHLIFSEILEFSKEDMLILEEIIPYLNKIGFSLKVFSNNSLVIEAVPSELRKGKETGFIHQFLETYKENDLQQLDVYERVSSSFACHAAIKAGDPLTFEEMNSLIDELFATKFPYYCPHGRPIVNHMSLEDLDRKFLR